LINRTKKLLISKNINQRLIRFVSTSAASVNTDWCSFVIPCMEMYLHCQFKRHHIHFVWWTCTWVEWG